MLHGKHEAGIAFLGGSGLSLGHEGGDELLEALVACGVAGNVARVAEDADATPSHHEKYRCFHIRRR